MNEKQLRSLIIKTEITSLTIAISAANLMYLGIKDTSLDQSTRYLLGYFTAAVVHTICNLAFLLTYLGCKERVNDLHAEMVPLFPVRSTLGRQAREEDIPYEPQIAATRSTLASRLL